MWKTYPSAWRLREKKEIIWLMSPELIFIKKALALLKPPTGASILELGCGEGRYTRAIAEEGFDVTGIDPSAEKISVALQSEKERLHFYTHDIRLPFHINYFDYALILFAHSGIYRTEREHSNAIRSVANSLKHQGYLLLDYTNNAGITLGDLNDMFAYHNLQAQEVYGDYELDAYDVKKSPRLIMLAKKK